MIVICTALPNALFGNLAYICFIQLHLEARENENGFLLTPLAPLLVREIPDLPLSPIEFADERDRCVSAIEQLRINGYRTVFASGMRHRSAR